MAEWLEQVWLSRYLDRQLDEAEQEWFETYALDKPHLVAAIDVDTDLRDGLRLSSQQGMPTSPQQRLHTFATHAVLAWSTAACALLMVGWFLGQMGSSSLALPELVASPTRIVLDVARSQQAEAIVYRGQADAEYLIVEIAVPLNASEISLETPKQHLPLGMNDEGFVSFLLQPSELDGFQGELSYRVGDQQLRHPIPLPANIQGLQQ